MKGVRFRSKSEAFSATNATKPSLLRRFVHRTKKIFRPNPPASLTTSRCVPMPPQLQTLTFQSASSVHEDPVLGSAEWLNTSIHSIHALAPHKTREISWHASEPAYATAPLDGASVYSQLRSDRIDFALPPVEVSNTSESKGITFTKPTRTTTSRSTFTTDVHQAEQEEDGKDKAHTRGQQSSGFANSSFFSMPQAEGYHQKETLLPRAILTDDAEDYSDCLAVSFRTADESPKCCEESLLASAVDVAPELISASSFSAQSVEEIAILRHWRAIFATRLEAELEMQKANLEADFDKCYETSDRLHEIDLINLKEDHEAEVKDLQEERDASLAEVGKLASQIEDLEGDVRISGTQVFGLEKLLRDRTAEAQTFQCQAKFFWEESNELASELSQLRHVVQDCGAHNQEVAHAHEMTAKFEEVRSQLISVVAHKNALQVQNTDFARRYEDVFRAYEAERTEKELAKRQLAALVDEKSKDFSWHMQQNRCHLVLKPEDEEVAESNATAMARELHRRETEKAGVLRDELAEVRFTTEAQLKNQARAILDLSELASARAAALDVSLDEKEELAKKYKALLTAMSVSGDLSELTRGLSRDLRTAFEQRTLFGLAFLEAELQITKSEQKRSSQVCDLRDLLQEKEDDIVNLKARLDEAESSSSAQEFILDARDNEIKKTVPQLKDRIEELEQMMELQATAAGQSQTHVIMDLKRRHERQKEIADYYEHHFVKTIYQLDNLKSEWSFYVGATVDDVQLARGFRDQRDALLVECLAMRERFADELLVRPLVVPEEMMTKSQIEEDELSNMHQGVLKQFLMTYKAIPKWLVEPGCPGYEQLRIEHMGEELARIDEEREKIHRSFHVDGENIEEGNFAEDLKEEEYGFF